MNILGLGQGWMSELFSKTQKLQLFCNNSRQRWKITRSPRPPVLRTTTSLQFFLPIRHYHFLSSPPPLVSSLLRSHFSTTTMSNSCSARKTVRVEIKGLVQGVFYRNWTVENARELGLNGWVRNRKDGSVEALFSGSSDKVDEMQQRCRRGPNAAMVTSLKSFPSTDDPGSGFERRATV